jgi:hypothetical protein
MSIFESSQYQPMPAPQSKKWPLLVGGLVVLAVLAYAAFRYLGPSAPLEALGLVVTEAQGQLQIQWNNRSQTIRRATKGTLSINDGASVSKVPLSRSELADGQYLYTRKGEDVEVRMEVEGSDGPLAESARFLGRPVVTPTAAAAQNDELESIENQRNALEVEVDRLKGQNSALSERIQQLERTQRILESRLGIATK